MIPVVFIIKGKEVDGRLHAMPREGAMLTVGKDRFQVFSIEHCLRAKARFSWDQHTIFIWLEPKP